MSRRLFVALVTAGLLGSMLAAAPASLAESSTICIGRQDTMQLSPGLSLAPTTGPVNTVVDGTQECNGPVEGGPGLAEYMARPGVFLASDMLGLNALHSGPAAASYTCPGQAHIWRPARQPLTGEIRAPKVNV